MLVLMLLAGCATNTRVIDSSCYAFEQILISRDDVLTEGTARQIWVHNEAWEWVCHE